MPSERVARKQLGEGFGSIVDGFQKQWNGFETNVQVRRGMLEQHMCCCGERLKVELSKCWNGEWRSNVLERTRDVVVQNLARIGMRQSVGGGPMLASLSSASSQWEPKKPLFDLAMSVDQVSRRLEGVPVYTVSNSANEFVLISDSTSQKSLGLFCFRHEDADALLSQVRDREPSLGRGARVVAVSLDKVYQLNTEGISFRFLPDPYQVKNAIEAKVRSGDGAKAFDGVPIFQSDNLILRSNNRRFCPIFFCKVERSHM